MAQSGPYAMKLTAYLSCSRHGIYYFRWPVPHCDGRVRSTVRLSLSTKCPVRAGDLARHLASCGRLVRDNKTLAKLRQDQIREMVRSYFSTALDRYTERLNDTGWPKEQIDLLRHELDAHKDDSSGSDDLSNVILDTVSLGGFQSFTKISASDWTENEQDLRREMRKGRRDQIEAFLSRAERLESYSYSDIAEPPAMPPAARIASLGDIFDDFMAEHSPQWSKQMQGKARGFLSVVIEYFGREYPIADITRHDASELKKVVQALPVNRNTKPETRDLSLQAAIEVKGLQKVSVETVNNHLAMFYRFWDWAERHDHAPLKLFEGMKVAKGKRASIGRKAYTRPQTARIFAELTENHLGLVKKDDHKWGALLALFSGARLNEIAQLEVGDIAQDDGIFYLNITDEGNNKKRLKANASRRKVPIHSELIRLGFLNWVNTKSTAPRLFVSFSFDPKDGYGRNLGRWFNGPFLKGLDGSVAQSG